MNEIEIDLTQLRPGESGLIKDFQGGHGFIGKLQGLGVRQGKRIIKVSSHFWRGPQTVEVDNVQIAIGFGMAKRIMVIVER